MYRRAFHILLAFCFLLILPGSSAAAAPTASVAYYAINGTNFVPSDSAANWSYGGFGCLGASSGLYHAAVDLPNGSIVTAITLGYSNTATLGVGVYASLQRLSHSSGSFSANSINVQSGTAMGFATATTNINPGWVIDNLNYTYMLSWSSSPNQQLCYIRLTYTPPSIFGVALPLVVR